jgi:hypothetical protein
MLLLTVACHQGQHQLSAPRKGVSVMQSLLLVHCISKLFSFYGFLAFILVLGDITLKYGFAVLGIIQSVGLLLMVYLK